MRDWLIVTPRTPGEIRRSRVAAERAVRMVDIKSMLFYYRARREYAYELRRRGAKFREIGSRLGVSVTRVSSMVWREQKERAAEAEKACFLQDGSE